MKRSKTQKIEQIIYECLKEMKIDKKLKEVDIINHWEEIIGKTIARATDNIYIKNKTLFIHLNSSVVRNELLMIRENLKAALNERAGEEIIENIVLK